MGRKNLLSLHEAIVIALINIDKKTFIASYKEIADYIEKNGLFPNREGNIDLEIHVMLRSTKSKKRYSYLFEPLGKDSIRLRVTSN
jgi:hypothetical protein